MSDTTGDQAEEREDTLADSDLEQPSTEQEPGEEPKGGTDQETEAQPSHEAVGIGVIDAPLTDPDAGAADAD
ncbi:hypothetical protein [Microbacterium caowuchunii]|uniref:Uncharacterized protein n=1 Tax=Microbacterium caowuchunii TaxID=2614638 RepID=A0A5N0TAN5_9MICO|nr:hypothetical protein [Microbacterium caowuchunii]KAA9131197.1 hypothetical protein F6B40_12970 [Microbacterium caowuchunii]